MSTPSDTPITELAIKDSEGCAHCQVPGHIDADYMRDLERAANAMRERLRIRNDAEVRALSEAKECGQDYNPLWERQIMQDSKSLAKFDKLKNL